VTYQYRGGKLKRWNELDRGHQASLLFDLLNAFSLLKSPNESALFITDLFTADEIKFLSKRLAIAKALLKGSGYEEIRRQLKTSPSTVAKVAAWLKEKGQGFRRIINKLPQRKTSKKGYDFPKSMWPLRLLEDLERGTEKAKDKNLKGVLQDLETKAAVRTNIQEQFNDEIRERKGQR